MAEKEERKESIPADKGGKSKIKRTLSVLWNNGQFPMLVKYNYETRGALFKWLNRRSQRRSYNWKEFNELLKYCPLVQPKIYHSIYKTATQT